MRELTSGSAGDTDTGPELIILVGIPGSGKSTWRRRRGADALWVCPDEIRRRLHHADFDPRFEGRVWRLALQELDAALAAGRRVGFDATNTTRRRRRPLLAAARRHAATPRAVFFDVPLTLALCRNLRRRRRVPASVIRQKFFELEPPTEAEGFSRVERVYSS